eukprot:10352078-Heterocapsa_arctica.AAC.1
MCCQSCRPACGAPRSSSPVVLGLPASGQDWTPPQSFRLRADWVYFLLAGRGPLPPLRQSARRGQGPLLRVPGDAARTHRPAILPVPVSAGRPPPRGRAGLRLPGGVQSLLRVTPFALPECFHSRGLDLLEELERQGLSGFVSR